MVYRPEDTDLTDTEIEALHALQLGREHLVRAHGKLLGFHHEIGGGMGYYERAYQLLREAGHDDLAADLVEPISLGVVDDEWSWVLVEDFEHGFLDRTLSAERAVREALADGDRHLNERGMERHRRERARSDGGAE